jgi:hypothetical protein
VSAPVRHHGRIRLVLLLVRARAWFDQHAAGFADSLAVYGGLLGLVLGVAGLVTGVIGPNLGFGIGVAGLGLSLVLLGFDWVERRRRTIVLEKESEVVAPVDPGPGGVLVTHRIGGESWVGTPDQIAVVWPELDELLPRANAMFSYSAKPKPLPSVVAVYAGEIIQDLARRTTYNAAHIRQDDDLSAAILTQAGTVALRKSRYFDLIYTNYLTGYRIRHRKNHQIVVHGSQLYRNGDRILSPTPKWSGRWFWATAAG